MRLGQRLIVLAVSLLLLGSCGPSYKTGDSQIKKIKNVHDITVIKKSKSNYESVRERKKEQRKANRERWKKQMKNRYKY